MSDWWQTRVELVLGCSLFAAVPICSIAVYGIEETARGVGIAMGVLWTIPIVCLVFNAIFFCLIRKSNQYEVVFYSVERITCILYATYLILAMLFCLLIGLATNNQATILFLAVGVFQLLLTAYTIMQIGKSQLDTRVWLVITTGLLVLFTVFIGLFALRFQGIPIEPSIALFAFSLCFLLAFIESTISLQKLPVK